MSKATEKLIAALESIPEIQKRIDLVAEDLESGKYSYAKIDAWKLGTLLGVDWDHIDGERIEDFGYRDELEDACFDHPFAENVELLSELVPQKRYARLAALATRIQGDDDDLPLTKKEIALIQEAYVTAQAEKGGCDAWLCSTTVTSTQGVELTFTAGIGDGGEAFDAQSPYDDGPSMDPAVFVKIDD